MALYLETNGQSNIANQKMEKHLCIFVNYPQNNWLRKLAIAKITANNNKSASTKLFLFFATKNFHLYISFGKVKLFNISTCKQIFNQKALDISGNMQITLKFV